MVSNSSRTCNQHDNSGPMCTSTPPQWETSRPPKQLSVLLHPTPVDGCPVSQPQWEGRSLTSICTSRQTHIGFLDKLPFLLFVIFGQCPLPVFWLIYPSLILHLFPLYSLVLPLKHPVTSAHSPKMSSAWTGLSFFLQKTIKSVFIASN